MRDNAVAAGFLIGVALLVCADLVADAGSDTSLLHLGLEGAATVVALVGGAWFLRRLLHERAEAQRLRARAEELLASVGTSIERRLEAWALTPAEREVTLLLLKGLSFKEIGTVRDTSPRTARDQARAVYKKAGVAGRAELAAWFLEDLLPPDPTEGAPT